MTAAGANGRVVAGEAMVVAPLQQQRKCRLLVVLSPTTPVKLCCVLALEMKTRRG